MEPDRWSDEEPDAAGRRARIESSINDLHCIAIRREEVRLCERYAMQTVVIRPFEEETPPEASCTMVLPCSCGTKGGRSQGRNGRL